MYYWNMTYPLYKYPSTPHLPISKGRQFDDTSIGDYQNFIGNDVVITEKMDGENASLYSHHYHARSLDSRHHPSRDWIKSRWASIRYNIPAGWRLCGENLYARHSIGYESLPEYFMLFSVWDENNVSLDWETVEEFASLLGLQTVPVLYKGPFDLSELVRLSRSMDLDKQEGFVIRNSGKFHYDDFGANTGKFVRPAHVQTDKHWMSQEIIPNGILK